MSDMRDLPDGEGDDAEAAAAVKAAVQILSPTYVLVPRGLLVQLMGLLGDSMRLVEGVMAEGDPGDSASGESKD